MHKISAHQVEQCFGGKYFVDYIEPEVEVLEQRSTNTPTAVCFIC